LKTLRPIAVLVALAATVICPTVAHAAVKADAPVLATFEGKTINLATGWGAATACVQRANGTVCYRTEAELDQQLATEPPTMVAAVCSSSVRLYRGAGFTLTVLALTTRQTVLNLSNYGFDNDTSSYKIGACSAGLYGAPSLGSPYPGSTAANASAANMVSGWDNTISSVYIN
jgi:hypothetical protein